MILHQKGMKNVKENNSACYYYYYYHSFAAHLFGYLYHSSAASCDKVYHRNYNFFIGGSFYLYIDRKNKRSEEWRKR